MQRALDDVAAQKFTDLEVVLVNDGDGGEHLRDIAARSGVNTVRVVDTVEPRGRCRAANLGIRESRGEYVVLHDDDDRWHPEFLSRTVERLDADTGCAGVMTSTAIVLEERDGSAWREIDRVPFWSGMERVSLTELLEINRAVPISFLYRRSVHDAVGWYDESLDAVEDWDFYLRVLPRFPIGFISGPPLAYWVHRPGATQSEANSTLGLQHEHIRDDLMVRDRELTSWVEQNGTGLPLYLAHLQRQTVERLSEQMRTIVRDEVRRIVAEELEARSPLGRRWRRMKRRLNRGGGDS